MTKTPDIEQSEEVELLYELIADSNLLTTVVLIGASALIPVPFLDDFTKSYLEKRLVNTIVENEGLEIGEEELEALLREEKGGCCAFGCLSSAILYPLKKLLRKVFFFLEIKRAVDQSTQALAQAWLFRLALYRELWKPGSGRERAEELRLAIRSACHSQGVKPLETALRHGFLEAKGVFSELAGKLTAKISGKSATDEKEIKEAVDKVKSEKSGDLGGLPKRLTDSVNDVSENYLTSFAVTFEQQLKDARNTITPESLA